MNSICQLFITDENISTTLCVHNYRSFLEGNNEQQLFILKLYDSTGKWLKSHSFLLKDNEHTTITLSNNFSDKNNKIGLAVLSSEFGNPHFYSLYTDGTSLAMIHPQMKVPPKQVDSDWTSTQTINTTNLSELRIYQANPTQSEVTSVYHLFNVRNDTTPCAINVVKTPSMSANYTTFTKFDHENVKLWTPRIICGNGKALIMRRYKSGLWTMNHG